MEPRTERNELARKLCFSFSLVAGGATAASMVALVADAGAPWTGVAAYAESFTDARLTTFVLWFILGVAFVPLVASLHVMVPERRQPVTLIAFAFAIMYATIVGFNYGLQFTFVRQSLHSGNLAGLEAWAAANPTSAIFAADMVGYLFQGLATLFLAPLFRGGRVATAVSWLFVWNGLAGVAGVAAIALVSFGSGGPQWIGVAVLLAWGVPLSAALFVLAYGLRRGLIGWTAALGPRGSAADSGRR